MYSDLYLAGVRSQEVATVSVPKEKIEVKLRESVSLECFGSNPSLSYYIKSRLEWIKTDRRTDLKKKVPLNITSSFYPTESVKKQFEEGHYKLDYKTISNTKGFLFNLTIAEVKHEDDGIYTCNLMGDELIGGTDKSKEVVVSHKTVHVIVLNPVERVTVRIKAVAGASSSTPIVLGDMPIKVKPGVYEVICESRGSNPAPIMGLMYNEAPQSDISVEYSDSIVDKQIKHKGIFHKSITFDATLGVEQTLVCSAKLPNGQYPMKEAGLKLHVAIDEPDIVCLNVSTKEDDKRVKLSCNLTTQAGSDALMCNKVTWRIPDIEAVIPATGDTSQRRIKTQDMDIFEADCMKKGAVMESTLTIYHVKQIHFKTLYYVKYDKFEIPVPLYEIVSAAHLLFPSLLMCVAVAIISKLAARTL